jgi:hypothetical protein
MALLFEIHFCSGGPGKFRDLTNMPLLCGLALRKNQSLAIGSLGARPVAIRWNSGELVAGLGQGSRGEVHVVTRKRFGPEGRWEQRRQVGCSALAPASSRPGQGSGWRARLYWVLGKTPEASVGSGCERNDGSTAAAPMAW